MALGKLIAALLFWAFSAWVLCSDAHNFFGGYRILISE
jgi:hypothetical protein